MKLIAIKAALSVAFASASAQECKGPANMPTDDSVAAQTAQCLLSIDNKLLVNERCNVLFSPDGREVDLDAGKHYAQVTSTLDRRGAGECQSDRIPVNTQR
jgi:hypothetical protein